ncbi:hypothetical protein FE257_000457 [Aspergillus nanangensis]|uniref:Uncharacterized protein n=1 Tax=Aspergillus nanangensis TaxID=2582783 RepID=A0AAD4CUV3_ASPNN|nr:hypothetical protein FE257_000457 [Aspergillus nanangensis]
MNHQQDTQPPSQRQWDSAAPSLLWAYQIRRELGHLVQKHDEERRTHEALIQSLQETITNMNEQINELRDNFNTRHGDLLKRYEGLAAENKDMKKRCDSVASSIETLASRYSWIDGRSGIVQGSLRYQDERRKRKKDHTGEDGPRRKKRNPRRSIPIVPADEEDLKLVIFT